MALNFANLISDYNGAVFAQAGVVEWGYVSPDWHFAVPNGLDIFTNQPNALTVGTELVGVTANAYTALISANYQRVRPSVATDAEGIWVALMRFHAVKRGLYADMAARRVKEEEYVEVDPLRGDWAHADNAVPSNATCREIVKWIKRFGNAVFHAIAYAFLARGHHYKTEYKELYERLMAAQGVDMRPTFGLPSFEIMFRLGIHCLGVFPLIDLARFDKINNLMSAPMMIRFTPHAPVSGVSHITTLRATITEMAKETWATAFNTKFAATITAIDNQCTLIHAHPYEYHVATAFITAQPRRYATADANKAFLTLAPFAIGYIDYLGRKHPLSGQKAVTQHSGGGGALADNFAKACQQYSKGDFTALTMTAWLNTV